MDLSFIVTHDSQHFERFKVFTHNLNACGYKVYTNFTHPQVAPTIPIQRIFVVAGGRYLLFVSLFILLSRAAALAKVFHDCL